MCRLFGFKASEKVDSSLYIEKAENAFEKQSKKDGLGHKNTDGWGFGYFDSNGKPCIKKEPVSAYKNHDFENTAENANSDILIGHIRMGSFGERKKENCHPFSFSRFILAQNGTMMGFNIYKEEILKKIRPELRTEIKGNTDTECLFFLFLSLLKDKRHRDITKASKEEICDTLKDTLKFIEDLYFTYTPNAQRPAFNIFLSDGENFFATRLNRTLFILEKAPEKEKPLQIFSQEHHWHVDFGIDDHHYHKVILASEKITPNDPDWEEVPENSLVCIDKDLDINIDHLKLCF